MSSLPTSATRPFPPALKFVCSAFAVGHLLLIGIYALAANSGPWITAPGTMIPYAPYDGPKFAAIISGTVTYPYYLEPLQMTHNYHFATNRPTDYAVYFQVHVKNKIGETTVLTYPDEKANFWVRHRQEILAQHLVPDQRLPPPGPRRLAGLKNKDNNNAKRAELPKIEVFKPDGELVFRLTEVSALDPLLNEQELDQPTPRAKLAALTYARYVCAQNNGVSAILVRHSRPTVVPMDVVSPRPVQFFGELKMYFGEYRRD